MPKPPPLPTLYPDSGDGDRDITDDVNSLILNQWIVVWARPTKPMDPDVLEKLLAECRR